MTSSNSWRQRAERSSDRPNTSLLMNPNELRPRLARADFRIARNGERGRRCIAFRPAPSGHAEVPGDRSGNCIGLVDVAAIFKTDVVFRERMEELKRETERFETRLAKKQVTLEPPPT